MECHHVHVGIVILRQTKLIMLPSKLVQPEWPEIPPLKLKKINIFIKS